MKYQETEQRILDFAFESDLLESDNLLAQSNRVRRDVEYLHDAVLARSKNHKEYFDRRNKLSKVDDDIKTYIGKLAIDLLILGELNNVDLTSAMEEAFKELKKK